MLARKFDQDTFSFLEFTWRTVFYIMLAFIMMLVRDVAYIYRLIILSDYQLNWKQAFQVIMLWEFSSAISPSALVNRSRHFFPYTKKVLMPETAQPLS